MQMIGMQYKHQELSRRSSSWHKAGRSSRFAESGVRTGSGATALKEKQNIRKRGVKRCLCANKGKPRLNNAMAA